ncbi:hypothetical protein PY257_06230 [Ramlibacter sp. H39-3-26]|uniref:hypothetical protein n=1 Tax=Curvibacter soli TaxID=3031331 RepID=UPI0023DC9A64|nr:hypothetical protein [Ramlibacter sp. H39-3-26]MDF1484786.1 hypothetical protein [Ramlibacter sp. H39-3-26]
MTRPRLSRDPSSHLFSIQSFGGISRFLLESVTDEETRQLRESMRALALHIDSILAARRQQGGVAVLGQRVTTLCDSSLRQHQSAVTALGPDWCAMYEYGSYLRSLGHLRDAAEHWRAALGRGTPDEPACFDAFDSLSWRTLGEGLLLIDMYEHWARQGTEATSAAPGARPVSPLARLRRWLRRRVVR